MLAAVMWGCVRASQGWHMAVPLASVALFEKEVWLFPWPAKGAAEPVS